MDVAYTRTFTVAVKRFQMVNLNKMYNYFDYSIQLFYKKPSNLEELTKKFFKVERDWCDSVRKTGYYIEIKASSQFLVTRGRHIFKNESRKLGVSRLCYSSIFKPSHKVRKHFEWISYAWLEAFQVCKGWFPYDRRKFCDRLRSYGTTLLRSPAILQS